MPSAARVGDLVKQTAPHCHTAHGPAGPIAHPPMDLPIMSGAMTVLIGGAPAAVVGSQTLGCMLAGCVPGGPGMVQQGSTTVLIGGMAAARVNDPTTHPACSAPIPSLSGMIMPPGEPKVEIGG